MQEDNLQYVVPNNLCFILEKETNFALNKRVEAYGGMKKFIFEK